MAQPDIKKLITGFLIAAIAAGSGAYLFSDARITQSSLEAPQDITETLPAAPANSLLNPLLLNANGELRTGAVSKNGGFLETLSPVNFTEAVTRGIVSEVAKANPNGITDRGNETTVHEPDLFYLKKNIDELLETSASLFVLPPYEKAVPEYEVKTTATFSPRDTATYLNILTGILKKTVHNPFYKGPVEDASLTMLSTTKSEFDEAIKILKGATVPAPLLNAHRSFTTIFLNQRNILAVISESQNDPLKAIVFLAANKATIDRDFKNFGDEYERINFVDQKTSQLPRISPFAFLRSLFEIFRANAQLSFLSVPVDILAVDSPDVLLFFKSTGGTLNAIKELLEEEKQHLLETEQLKRDMERRLATETKAAIRTGNSGDTYLVDDMEAQLGGSADQAGDEIIGKALASTCPSNVGTIRNVLGGGTTPPAGAMNDVTQALKCPTTGINMGGFYNDFRTGGWNALFRVSMPSGNARGSLAMTHEFMAGEAEEAEEAQKTEVQANNGFESFKQCIQRNSNGSCFKDVVLKPGGVISEAAQRVIVSNVPDQIANAQQLLDGPAAALFSGDASKIIASFRDFQSFFSGSIGSILTSLFQSLLSQVQAKINQKISDITSRVGGFNQNSYLQQYTDFLNNPQGFLR